LERLLAQDILPSTKRKPVALPLVDFHPQDASGANPKRFFGCFEVPKNYASLLTDPLPPSEKKEVDPAEFVEAIWESLYVKLSCHYHYH